jgi:phospholipid/cholesterol/gamma-HCH transport system permease protein
MDNNSQGLLSFGRMIDSFKLFLHKLQAYSIMVGETVRRAGAVIKYRRETLDEMYTIGAKAFWLVTIGSLFVGIILALETGYQLAMFGAKALVGRTVSLGMVRELGPVISGLLLAARTGAKNTSEIGAMELSEQIDALRAFGTDPVRKLAVPRMVAAVVMFLPLTGIADMVGIFGGMEVTRIYLHVDPSFFWNSAIDSLKLKDVFVGFAKPIFFGFFVSTISCFYGFSTKGGTVGLGKNTISAVVVSSVVILILDFIFTKVVWEMM